MSFSSVLERVAMALNILSKIEVLNFAALTLDVDDKVQGIVNFFGDFEPKSIGDNEDKIYWYMKVCLSRRLSLLVVAGIHWPTESNS